jgi:hypothetical protein
MMQAASAYEQCEMKRLCRLGSSYNRYDISRDPTEVAPTYIQCHSFGNIDRRAGRTLKIVPFVPMSLQCTSLRTVSCCLEDSISNPCMAFELPIMVAAAYKLVRVLVWIPWQFLNSPLVDFDPIILDLTGGHE